MARISNNIHRTTHDNVCRYHATLLIYFHSGDSLGFTAKPEYELAVHALGGLTWYLNDSQLDLELLSMRNFEEYIPIDRAADTSTSTGKSKTPAFMTGRHHMVCIVKTNYWKFELLGCIEISVKTNFMFCIRLDKCI